MHSLPALVNNCTSGIILVLSKLIPLASGHDDPGSAIRTPTMLDSNHVSDYQYVCQTPTMVDANHISNNQWVHIYLSCIYFYCHNYNLTRVCLFVSLNSPDNNTANRKMGSRISNGNREIQRPHQQQQRQDGYPQQQQTLQPERDPTMAMAIVTHRQ